MSTSMAIGRLTEERKNWRKDHPSDIFARPSKNADGSTNLMLWECGLNGKKGTDWEGGVFNLTLKFSDDYPVRAPVVIFNPVIYHPNVYPHGAVCLSIIGQQWKASISVKEILIGVQDLLDTPNPLSPANPEAGRLFASFKADYSKRIKQQTEKHKAASTSN